MTVADPKLGLTPGIEAVMNSAEIILHPPAAHARSGGRVSILIPGYQWRLLDLEQALTLRAEFYGWGGFQPSINHRIHCAAPDYGLRAAYMLEKVLVKAGFADRIYSK